MKLSDLLAPRFWRMFVLPWVVWAGIAYFTNDQALILIENIIRVSLAAAVVITYSRECFDVLFGRQPMNRGSWIAYGIWWGWASVAYAGLQTLVWRLLGQPMWIVNSDISSLGIFMACIGAVGHIAKPGDINDELPRREQIRIGLIIGGALAVGLTLVYLPVICNAWNGGESNWMPPRMEKAAPSPPQECRPPGRVSPAR